ncbi:MAG: Nif3-like dinuclear metal center hexameric protein [Fibrobacterota bacterium]
MIPLSELCSFLSDLLSIHRIDDYSHNGLQFEGSPEVHKIGFAVDAGCGVFEKAAEEGIDMLVVHHGLFWKKANPSVTGMMKNRISLLYENNMSLFAAHLPLDMHSHLGHNARILDILNVKKTFGFSPWGSDMIGAGGVFPTPVSVAAIKKNLDTVLGGDCRVLNNRGTPVGSVAVFSGSAGRKDFHAALSRGTDVFITGEESDIFHDARDAQATVLFLGHHRSEKPGMWALQKAVKERFFLDDCYISYDTFL